jgi:hypothetical protein
MICGFIDMKHAGKDQHPCRPVGPFFTVHPPHVPAFEEQRPPRRGLRHTAQVRWFPNPIGGHVHNVSKCRLRVCTKCGSADQTRKR